MKIVILMEDTRGVPCCEYEHGLSVYIETKNHKLLVDTGASEKIIQNAKKLDIDLSLVDTVVLSHGHYDHSGGMTAFRKINGHAVIYMQQTALGDYYHGERYIGIDKQIGSLEHTVLLKGDQNIDQELSLFTGIRGKKYWPTSNRALSMKKNGQMLQDEFEHEQCLAVMEDKKVLVSGCAHNGILNILDAYEERYGGLPDIVISGFHMMKKTDYTEKETEIIKRTADELAQKDILFYTGHCTGQKAIDLMKPIMGERLVQIHCGMETILSAGGVIK